MTIIVEDGTGVTDANSYASVANLTAYATLRGITLPVADADKEILLIKAMDYLDTFTWIGTQDYPETDFPRSGIGYDDIIPKEIVKAQIVAAIASMTVELLPVQAFDANSKKVVQVGPIKVEYVDAMTRDTAMPMITQLAALLDPFTYSYGGQFPVVRV